MARRGPSSQERLRQGRQRPVRMTARRFMLDTDWRVDVDVALADARRAGRPALLVFHAAWNGTSTQMKRESFYNPAVVTELARRRTLIEVDATDADDPKVADVLKRF